MSTDTTGHRSAPSLCSLPQKAFHVALPPHFKPVDLPAHRRYDATMSEPKSRRPRRDFRDVLVHTPLGLEELEEQFKSSVQAGKVDPKAVAQVFMHETFRTIAHTPTPLTRSTVTALANQALDFEKRCIQQQPRRG